jgi:predicted acylesterase/phospholipase RssA
VGLFQTTWVWLAGDTQIEDLPIPFFCVSANLTRPGAHVHTRGLLARSVLATTRVPGLFPPIVEQGDLLVDGAIADNLPVQCMKSFAYGGRVIASDVAPAAETTAYADYGLVLSGWQHLLRKLIPFNRRNWLVPSLDYILMRTVEFGSAPARRRAEDMADLYIRPPLKEFKVNDYKLASRIAQVGYEYAKPRVEEWLRRIHERPNDASGKLHEESANYFQ